MHSFLSHSFPRRVLFLSLFSLLMSSLLSESLFGHIMLENLTTFSPDSPSLPCLSYPLFGCFASSKPFASSLQIDVTPTVFLALTGNMDLGRIKGTSGDFKWSFDQ